MLKSDNGLYINIHEAALVNYPAMHLNLDAETYLMSAHLTPDKNGEQGIHSDWKCNAVAYDYCERRCPRYTGFQPDSEFEMSLVKSRILHG